MYEIKKSPNLFYLLLMFYICLENESLSPEILSDQLQRSGVVIGGLKNKHSRRSAPTKSVKNRETEEDLQSINEIIRASLWIL
jgi:hypothetical protein